MLNIRDEKSDDGYAALKILGLNKSTIACYATLYEMGPSKAVALAARLHKPQTGLYRSLKTLEALGFIKKFDIGILPVHYRALPLETGLANLHAYQRSALNETIRHQAARATREG